MRQDAFEGLPWASVSRRLSAITSAGYSVGILTTWTGNAIAASGQRHAFSTEFRKRYARPTGATLGCATNCIGDRDPAATNPFGVQAPWSERLAHFKPDRHPGPLEQIQKRVHDPAAQATTAFARLRAIGHRIDPLLYVTREIRTMAGDALWLSPAYGGGTSRIHFTWKREPRAVHVLSAEIEDMLLPLRAARIGAS